MGRKLHHVVLSSEQKDQLNKIAFSGSEKVYRIVRARALLKAASGATDIEIAQALDISRNTVVSLRKQFAKEGLESCLNRKEQQRRHRKVTGDIEARIVQLYCSEPPEGRVRWTLDLLTDRIAELRLVPEGLGRSTIHDALKKTTSSPGKPNPSASLRKKTPNS
jgi:transposase